MREEIIKLLDQYRLKEALSQMTGYATHTSDWQLKNELEAGQRNNLRDFIFKHII